MRVCHFVTLVSDRGAYGGPLTVAVNQAGGLVSRGYDAMLVAGWHGSGDAPERIGNVGLSTFPVRQVVPGTGFSGLFSLKFYQNLDHILSSVDIAHIHAGRDLMSIAVMEKARKLGIPYVVQTHGMVGPDARLKSKLLDGTHMRRLLRGASRRFVLTPTEAQDFSKVVPNADVSVLANGVPNPSFRVDKAAWEGQEVVFCARLHKRKRPVAFVELAKLVAASVPEATFSIIGPDEGELPAVLDSIVALGLQDVVRYEGALSYEKVLGRLSRAAVYVLPSVNEPFPMSLLEAMSLGLPSVLTDSCGIAPKLKDSGSAIVSGDSVPAMASAVISLLQGREYWAAMSEAARSEIRENFSIDSVVADLSSHYESVLN